MNLRTLLGQLHREERRLAADLQRVSAAVGALRGQQRVVVRTARAVERRQATKRARAKRNRLSPAARAAVSARMKKYWAGRRRKTEAA